MTDGRRTDVVAAVAVVAGFLLAVGLALAAFVTSLCGLFGDECSSDEQGLIQLLWLASVGVFFFVPAGVAAWRGQARWMLAPVIEVSLFVLLWAAVDWF